MLCRRFKRFTRKGQFLTESLKIPVFQIAQGFVRIPILDHIYENIQCYVADLKGLPEKVCF
jgi:hypothetical protein